MDQDDTFQNSINVMISDLIEEFDELLRGEKLDKLCGHTAQLGQISTTEAAAVGWPHVTPHM